MAKYACKRAIMALVCDENDRKAKAVGVMGGLILLTFIAGFLGLAGTVAVLGGLAYGVRRGVYALKGQPYRPLLGSGSQPAYEHQDVDAGATADSLKSVFRRYLQASGVGPYARAGMDALDSAERKAANFRVVLDNKFQPNSITWSKFSSAGTTAQEAVLRNCAELANEIQLFDHTDYRALEQARRRSRFRSDSQLSETQIEKYHMFDAKLDEMKQLCDTNERILLELDKLGVELDKLDDAGSSAESERLVEEIRTLIDETKYYKQGLEDLDSKNGSN